RDAVARLFGDPLVETISLEARLLCKDGAERLVGLDAARSTEDRGVICVARDLSSRLSVEQGLARIEEMFRLVVDNVPQQICWRHMNAMFLGCNKRFAAAAGLADPDEIIGRKDEQVPWTDDAPSSRAYGRGLMGPDPVGSRSVEPLISPNGTKAWLDLIKL